MPRKNLIIGLLVVAAVQALLFWLYYWPAPKLLWGDEATYLRAAQAIGVGADPELSPLWPPLYPQALSKLLISGTARLSAIQLSQLLLLVGVAWTARDLWRRLVAPDAGGDWLALLILGYPPLAAFAGYLWPEVLHLAFLAGALWILAARRTSLVWLFVLGLVLGCAVQAKSLLVPFLPVLLLPLLLDAGRWSARLRRVGLVLLALVLCVAPTVGYNLRHHGKPTLAGSARFNVWVGLNETSRQSFSEERVVGDEYQAYLRSAPDERTRSRILGQKLRELVAQRGVWRLLRDQLSKQYFRLLDRDSFLTLQLEGGALWQRGFGYQDRPALVAAGLRWLSYVFYAALLISGVMGMVLCPPRGRKWMWLVLAFLAYNLLIFLFLHVNTRYRVQFLPFLMLYSVLGVRAGRAWLGGKGDADSGPLPSATHLAAGCVGAAIVLFFAFGGALLD